jgi:sugar phosphate isomerase/epimerase
MQVAASTACLPELNFADAIQRLIDLEFTCVEIALHEHSNQYQPSRLVDNLEEGIRTLRDSHRLDICSYDVRMDAHGDDRFVQFDAICKLAKATKVVTITVPSAELGTPFNEEVEYLQKLVEIADVEGVRVSMKSQIGRLTEDPDSVQVLCDHVEGLGLTLDPSHYMCGPHSKKDIEMLMKYVFHVHLRDSKKDVLQVRVGQGIVDYGKIISQLQRVGYDHALSIEITPAPDIEMRQELRKLRLLLDSLL